MRDEKREKLRCLAHATFCTSITYEFSSLQPFCPGKLEIFQKFWGKDWI